MENFQDQGFDAIIAGTGPGGATVARELTLRGKRVLMLEWGPGDPIRGTLWQYIREQCWPGRSMLITNGFLGIFRGISTGGSSLFYYGTCFPVPHAMLQSYGIDVTEEEAEARKELPVGVLKKEMVTPMASRIMESARELGRELGYDWNLLEKFMYQNRWKPGQMFGYYGDPNDVKWSGRMHIREAVKNGAILRNGTMVNKVILDGNKAKGIEYRFNGKMHRAFAPVVVISAGGIGSPVILRKTEIQEAGYDFFYDPVITVTGKMKDVCKRSDEIPMSAGIHLDEDGIVMTDMALPPALDKLLTAQVFRFTRLFESGHTARIMIKIRDDLFGRLTNGGGVRKALTARDKAKLMKGYRIAKEILENAGARGVYKTWYAAAHPGGTVKVGELLDSDLKVKNHENLYVCDCSVIPEPWGLPPVMTIVSLGKRLAKLLAGKSS